ncbi:MAG: FHA domain-containing protein [Gemmataceae bacterium]|nr:FHA domain-containing protein [Gemmataceae bacterium]MCI0738584.1 FHA domain-containing protein [Gemmataceae bacterium]
MDVQLKVVQGKPNGHALRFADGEFIFGRGPECHVRPNSDWVSRQHCMLRVHGDRVSIRDLGSTNGTLVNGHLLTEETDLQNGDRLQLGALVLQLVLLETPLAPLVPSITDTVVDQQHPTLPGVEILPQEQ